MNSSKVRLSVALLLIAVGLLAASGWLDRKGYEFTEAGLQRALITFGISRSLNGVISVAQGTEVAVEPVGIGMTFAPGQILDPVNDLVERFSTVVLAAGTAFGAQHILLDVTASSLFAWIFNGSIFVCLVGLVFWIKLNDFVRQSILRVTFTLIVLRLATPIFSIGGELFYQQFLEPQYQASSEKLKQTTATLTLLNQETAAGVEQNKADDLGFFESAKTWVQSAGAVFDWKAHLAEFSNAAEAASEHAIRLTVVFIFQTLLLPLLAIWLTLRLGRYCLFKTY
ncbi:MAG: hypothetical protein MK188_04475 [Gammaproteobacteria bacterium]|nr:hypothetical protein [Gammaproteobacteria bacterium]